MHERREEYADALKCYQRALRCDPKSATIARAIIPVAVRLKRYSEAVRYVLKAVELEDADPLLLRRLGTYLTEEGDWARALTLYEKALAARGKGKETAADVLLRMEMGRLYYLTEKYKPAAECFARVLYAINHPDEFALDQQLTKVLLSEPGTTYQLMGECFLSADRPQEALAVFEKADQAAPNKALRQFNLARVYAKTGKPAEALAALEACFAEHLADEGMVPVRNAGRRAEQPRQEGGIARSLGKAPCRRAAQPAAGLLSGGPVSSRRQARQGRSVVPRTVEEQTHARAATAAWSRSLGRPSGSTSCWPPWARRWRRPACWTVWGPRHKRSPATPSRCAAWSKPRGAR